MSVKRRKGSPHWWYDFTINSRRFRGSTKTDDHKTAEIIEAKLRSDILLERFTDKKPQHTLDEAFGRYWLDHASRLPSAYNIEYQSQNLLAGLGKHTPLNAIADDDVATYVAHRRAEVSDSSVNRELTLFRSVLRMAANKWKWDVVALDWAIHWLNEPAHRKRYLKANEYERLMAELASHIKPMVTFSVMTGVRLANCVTLDWSQIDMQARQISFTVKGGKFHFLPITEPLLVLLANQKPEESGPVFKYRGRPIKSPKKGFKRACERAGIEDFRWHDLRHTAASWMVQAGIPLVDVKETLAHADIQTTLRYAHLEKGAKQRAMEAAAAQIGHIALVEDKQAVDK